MTLANSLSDTGIGSPTSKSACMIYDETKGSRTGAGFGLCTGSPAGVAIEKPGAILYLWKILPISFIAIGLEVFCSSSLGFRREGFLK